MYQVGIMIDTTTYWKKSRHEKTGTLFGCNNKCTAGEQHSPVSTIINFAEPSPTGRKIGTPYQLVRYPFNKEWKERKVSDENENQDNPTLKRQEKKIVYWTANKPAYTTPRLEAITMIKFSTKERKDIKNKILAELVNDNADESNIDNFIDRAEEAASGYKHLCDIKEKSFPAKSKINDELKSLKPLAENLLSRLNEIDRITCAKIEKNRPSSLAGKFDICSLAEQLAAFDICISESQNEMNNYPSGKGNFPNPKINFVKNIVYLIRSDLNVTITKTKGNATEKIVTVMLNVVNAYDADVHRLILKAMDQEKRETKDS